MYAFFHARPYEQPENTLQDPPCIYIIMYTTDDTCQIFARLMRLRDWHNLASYFNNNITIFSVCACELFVALLTHNLFFIHPLPYVDGSHAFSRTPPRITYARPRDRIAFDTKLFVLWLLLFSRFDVVIKYMYLTF